MKSVEIYFSFFVNHHESRYANEDLKYYIFSLFSQLQPKSSPVLYWNSALETYCTYYFQANKFWTTSLDPFTKYYLKFYFILKFNENFWIIYSSWFSKNIRKINTPLNFNKFRKYKVKKIFQCEMKFKFYQYWVCSDIFRYYKYSVRCLWRDAQILMIKLGFWRIKAGDFIKSRHNWFRDCLYTHFR